MRIVNLRAAKPHLSRLVDAAAGEDILIARAGRPVARLMPLQDLSGHPRRQLGQLAGQLRLPEDCDAPLPNAGLAGFEQG
ncbi:MAG: antitoxin [Roseomonas sp.]|nr:antitoxin [Roseomonas sp.]